MAGSGQKPVPADYYTAVYVCVSLLLSMMVGLLLYVVCSKRFKLNWFEKTQLAEVESEKGHSTVESGDEESEGKSSSMVRNDSPLRFIMTQSATCPVDSSSTGQCSAEAGETSGFQRQTSFFQGDVATDFSGEESIPGTPNTPLGIKMSPFALSQMGVSDRTPSPLVKYVQPGCPSSVCGRPRVATMYSKLDHTKIDATMYQKQEPPPSTQAEDTRGSIHFAVTYNTQFFILCVHLIQARDLVARDFSGTSDPYAKVRLLPDKKVFRESNIHRKTLNPQFEEEFVFDLPPEEISSRTLEILLYDYDQYSRHQCMGNIQIPLHSLDLKDKVTLWKGISPCDEKDDKPELGDLMFSLGYLLSAEHLTVVILKARNLRAVDEAKNTADPYVKVALTQGGRRLKKKKTSTQRGTLHPVFNEALTFNISKEVLKTVTMEFTVMNDNILSSNEILGRVIIGPNSKGDEALHFRNMMASKTAVAMWHTLAPLDST